PSRSLSPYLSGWAIPTSLPISPEGEAPRVSGRLGGYRLVRDRHAPGHPDRAAPRSARPRVARLAAPRAAPDPHGDRGAGARERVRSAPRDEHRINVGGDDERVRADERSRRPDLGGAVRRPRRPDDPPRPPGARLRLARSQHRQHDRAVSVPGDEPQRRARARPGPPPRGPAPPALHAVPDQPHERRPADRDGRPPGRQPATAADQPDADGVPLDRWTSPFAESPSTSSSSFSCG